MARKTEQRSRKARGRSVAKPALETTSHDAQGQAGSARTIVLVAGMHRSGTSALTGVLNSRGMVIAEDLMSSSSDNEKGFFESIALADIHDKFFAAIGHGYDNARSLPADAFAGQPGSHLRARLINHIKSFESQGDILIKDPRISRLLPVWKDVAASLNATLKLVIAVRNPLEVAASLDRRDRLSYERSLLLWLRYMVSAEKESRELNRVVVSYPRLLRDWRGQTDRISRELGLALPPATKKVSAVIDEFLAPDLRHHRVDDYSVYEDPRVPDWVRNVYAEYLKAADDQGADLTEVVDHVAGQLAESGDFIESIIARSDGRNFDAAERMRELTSALDDARVDLEMRTQTAESREAELGALRAELASKEAELAGVRREMRQVERSAVGLDDESDAAPGSLASYVAGLRVKIEEAATALERAREEADRYKRSAADLEVQLTEARRSASELATQLDALEEDHRLQAARDKQAIGIAEGEVARLNIETERLQALLTEATSEQSLADADGAQAVDALQASLDELQAEAADARAAAEKATQAAEQVREKYEEAKAAAAEIPELRERMQGLADGLAAAVSTSAELIADKQEALERQSELMAQIAALQAKQVRAEEARKELVRLRAERARSKKREYAQDRVLAAREADISDLEARLEAANAHAARLEVEQQHSLEEVRSAREADALQKMRAEQLEGEVAALREQSEHHRLAEEAAHTRNEHARASLTRLTQAFKSRLGGSVSPSDEVSDPVAALTETMDSIERRTEWLEDRFRRGVRPKSALATSITRSGLLGGFVSVVTGLYSPSLAFRPVRAARLAHQAELIRKSGAFDEAYYLERNWDVRLSNVDPVMHYLTHGAAEGRDPSPEFSTKGYLRAHWDVAAAKVNPLVHHIRHGSVEGRRAGTMSPMPASGPAPSVEPQRLADEAVIDPYDLRPDDAVLPEAQVGTAFLERFDLLGDDPQFAAAVSELNSMARRLRLAPDGVVEGVQVSIIVPVYGQLAYTLNCLHSLACQASDLCVEVIVVDDCSVDQTPDWLPQVGWIRYVRQVTNGGFISSCNLGADQARGEMLVFLNNDTRVVPGWLDELARTFDMHPDAGLVGSKLFYPDGSLQEAGGIFWRDGSAWNYGRNDDPNRPEYCYARQIDYVSGASIAVKRGVWNEVGGFDGDYYDRAYCEDSDLAFQIRKAGYETWFQPLSRVIHYEGKTSGTDTGGGEKAYQISNQKKFFERWQGALSDHAENGVDPYAEANRGARKIALVVDATSPMPWRDAGSVTVINTIRALQRLGFRVVFVPQDNFLFLRPSAELMQRMGVEVLYLPYIPSIRQYLTEHDNLVELVHIFRYPVARAELANVREAAAGAHVTFNVMDLHHLRVQREAELSGDSELMKLATGDMKRDELQVLNDVDTAFVHTVPERDIVLAERPNANVALYPYVTDEAGRDAPFGPRSGIMFLGGYDHSPNVDAAEFFVSEVMPILRTRLPGVRIHLAGSNANARILALAADDVIIDGFVPKLQSYYARFRVFVAPLRYGAGIKGKVAAAMVHGVPSVISSIAAEGMDLQDGVQCFVRDDAADIADAILEVYDDEQVWTAMSDAAMNFGQAAYSLDTACRAFEQALGGGKATG
ncbi:glycosyltransferase [Maricaulis sp.]|uniref:glycosyltransferase n=1 Tax=Maricaulis sp. TaxID=1486257 RepID=UPI003A906B79